jgi:hypothetical protein
MYVFVFHAQVSIPIICTFWGYSFCQYYNTYTLGKQTQSADKLPPGWLNWWLPSTLYIHVHVLSYVHKYKYYNMI